MSEDEQQESNPKLVFGDLGLKQSIIVELETPKAVVTKEGKYGEWQLWFGKVENVTVHKGRGNDEKLVPNYTGKVIFFPSEKLIPQLEKAANGNEGVKVKITKDETKMSSGKKYTKYVVEKLSEGKPSDSSLLPTESRLINEAKELINDGHNITEDIFIKASQEPQYENKISEIRAKELFLTLK